MARNNVAQSSHNRAREVVERLARHCQNPLDGMTSQKGGPLLSIAQNGSNDVEFWASVKTNFIRKTYCILEVESSVRS